MIQPVPPHLSQTDCMDITLIIVQTHAAGGKVSRGRRQTRPAQNGPLGRGPDYWLVYTSANSVRHSAEYHQVPSLSAGLPLLTNGARDQAVGAVAGIVTER